MAPETRTLIQHAIVHWIGRDLFAPRYLTELIPLASAVLVPPGEDPNDYSILDYTMEETNTFAFNALNRRLKVVGIDPAALAAAV